MVLWSNQGRWLFSPSQHIPEGLQKAFLSMEWELLPEQEWRGTAWSAEILKSIEDKMQQGADLVTLLEKHQWPFLNEIKEDAKARKTNFILDSLTSHLFEAGSELPAIPLPKQQNAERNAFLFSAYCRAYGIQLTPILQGLEEENEHIELILECPLTTKQRTLPPTNKEEENIPLLALNIKSGAKDEHLTLSYDRHAQGLKWPDKKGGYLFRFQPLYVPLPYEIRLRRARQVSYPGTNQAYSYESDLIVTDTRTGRSVESTISMNNVHETWDGYRFYLSSMSPNDESAAKRIQLAVNLDPAKYFLTYPGAIILSLGIILLFWLRPYQKKL